MNDRPDDQHTPPLPDDPTIEYLLQRASLCEGGKCPDPKYATAVVTSPLGVTYTATRAHCRTCQSRAVITSSSDGYRRVVVTPAGSTRKALAIGRRKETWVTGTATDPEAEDEADMEATLEVTTKSFLAIDTVRH